MKFFNKTIASLVAITAILLITNPSTSMSKGDPSGSTLFRVINCQVLNPNGTAMPVVAYRSMKNPNEVILINLKADHALLIDLKSQKAYKVAKPLLGTNAVNVGDERPDQFGNVGFNVRNVPGKKDLTEIIVYFQNDTCFLCGGQTFAAIWE